MVMLVFLGIACELSLKSGLASLHSLAASKQDYEDKFPDMPLDSLLVLTAAFYHISTAGCFTVAILLLVVFIKGLSLIST